MSLIDDFIKELSFLIDYAQDLYDSGLLFIIISVIVVLIIGALLFLPWLK